MSRVTPPVTKLSHAVRSLSRQSGLQHESSAYHTQTHTLHRPTAHGTHTPTIPLMQGFRTTAAPSPSPSTRTIDFITLPTPPAAAPLNPFSRVRVPLLPDSYTLTASAAAEEAAAAEAEASPARAEIHVVDIDTASARVAALSEVVGNESTERPWGREWAEMERVREGRARTGEEEERSVLSELWNGIVEDVFGKDGGKKLAV